MTTKTTSDWLCDVVGCDQEWVMAVGSEKRCFHHAREKADEEEAQQNVKT